MSDNLTLWKSVERTPKEHTKAITGKAYRGTSPKPHYIVQKATETFGPCGIGWGFTISERVEDGAPGERLHIAHVRVWYVWKDKRGEVEHIGQTMLSGKRKDGTPYTDEDAPKKSVTDGLVKALSLVGFAGDIFMGRYDDSKYVASLSEPANDEDEADDEMSARMADQVIAAIKAASSGSALDTYLAKPDTKRTLQAITEDDYQRVVAAGKAKRASFAPVAAE